MAQKKKNQILSLEFKYKSSGEEVQFHLPLLCLWFCCICPANQCTLQTFRCVFMWYPKKRENHNYS